MFIAPNMLLRNSLISFLITSFCSAVNGSALGCASALGASLTSAFLWLSAGLYSFLKSFLGSALNSFLGSAFLKLSAFFSNFFSVLTAASMAFLGSCAFTCSTTGSSCFSLALILAGLELNIPKNPELPLSITS